VTPSIAAPGDTNPSYATGYVRSTNEWVNFALSFIT